MTILAYDTLHWGAVLPLYLAFSFVLLAVAYGGVGPRLFFKRPDGRHSLLGWLLFAPYFLLNSLTFCLYRFITHESAYVQVLPNLYFGRRLTAKENQPAYWTSILDLAVEFPATWIPTNYQSMPVLDTTAPSETELRFAVAWIGQAVSVGPVYVHCALGHGRSACVVIAYLLSVGSVATAVEGLSHLRSLRHGVRLHPPQMKLLRQIEASLIAPHTEKTR